MTEFLHRSARFFAELRRRRVIRNVIGYGALSLLLIEASSNILPPLGIDEDAVLRWVILACIVGLPAVLALSWIYDIHEGKVVRTEAAPEAPRPGAASVPDYDRRHLVVLPFEDLSGEEAGYFADGITDDLTGMLAGLAELRVTSRTSARTFRGRDCTTHEIAHELRVGSVLEGTVRRAGDRVRIVVRLVDTKVDRPIWSDTYDRQLENVLEIQSEVARCIADALEAELSDRSRDRLARIPTVDVASYDAYLRGRFEWARRTEGGLENSLAHLSAALVGDPAFALAHAARADTLITLALYGIREPGDVLPEARDAARRALELDAGNAEAVAALACVRAIHEWDWQEAERGFATSLQASPSYATAHQWRAMHLWAPLGRFDDARRDLERAAALDPAAPAVRASGAFLAILEGRFADAEGACEEMLAGDPTSSLGHLFLGEARLGAGRPGDAVTAFERAIAVRGRAPDALAGLARARAGRDDRRGALALRDELVAQAQVRYVSPGRIGEVCAALGDSEAALGWLGRAVDRRAVDLIWIAVSPAWAPLREDPAFASVRARLRV